METDAIMLADFVELVPYQRIDFRFGWEGIPAGDLLSPCSTRVEVTLTRRAHGMRVTSRHHDVLAGRRGDHHAGWEHHLAVLAQRASMTA